MLALVMLCLGAAVGAPARYLTDRVVQARHRTAVPWGTLTVNISGSFILGVLAGVARQHPVADAVLLGAGTGFCGTVTTYSTFSYETLRLWESRAHLYAVLNVTTSIFAGLGAFVVGTTLGLVPMS